MPQIPRIVRTAPTTDAVQPQRPIPVEVTMIWHDGSRQDVPALARAWTRSEVEVEWTTPWGERRQDWVKAAQVRRR